MQLGASVVKGIDARVQVLYRIEEPKNNELSSREQAPGGVDCLANRDADVASEDDVLPECAPPVFGTGK